MGKYSIKLSRLSQQPEQGALIKVSGHFSIFPIIIKKSFMVKYIYNTLISVKREKTILEKFP